MLLLLNIYQATACYGPRTKFSLADMVYLSFFLSESSLKLLLCERPSFFFVGLVFFYRPSFFFLCRPSFFLIGPLFYTSFISGFENHSLMLTTLLTNLFHALGMGKLVQFSSVAQSCPTLRPHESQHVRPHCPSPTPGVYSNSCPSSQWCHPAISSSLVPFSSCPQSLIRVFSSESTLHMRWPKYWSFSFSISRSNEHTGLISFRMDWLDLLAGQETLKSLLQHHSSKVSILWCSAFFIV